MGEHSGVYVAFDTAKLKHAVAGYYQGLAVMNGLAHPIWTDTRHLHTHGEEIYTARLAVAEIPAPTSR